MFSLGEKKNILNLHCADGSTTLNKQNHQIAHTNGQLHDIWSISQSYLKKKRWDNGHEFAGNQYL